jgi:prepilin-type N-terminal cleavage/methylation domain-containing protein
MNPKRQLAASPRAFTLLEVMIAMAVFAILMASLNSVLFSTLHLRAKTASLVEDNLALNQSLAIIKRDVRGLLPPGGILATNFYGLSSSSGMGTINHLDFYTTSGIVEEGRLGGDIQMISYYLKRADSAERKPGFEFIRAVTRNLLPCKIVEPEEEALIAGVRALDFSFYSGADWRSTWDTSVMTNLPTAIRLTITLEPEADAPRADPPYIELFFPVTIQARTNLTNIYIITNVTTTTTASLGGGTRRGAA